ncbi:MAG TPA: hypothetical protein VFD60_10560 [Nitrososphaeraceae archaeon]|nr:hypothetical protein [Nitrososphaeraceae archaeon]
MEKDRPFDTLDDFVKNLHKEGSALIDFNRNKIPCIYINPARFDEIMNAIHGKKLAVDSLLNIFHNGYDVFVDVQLNFLNIGIKENYLLYANDMLGFFEALSNTGLIALAPNLSIVPSSSNIFMIQLPKKEAAENAFEIIKANIKNKRS